jgi:Tol biopolymer transport system component
MHWAFSVARAGDVFFSAIDDDRGGDPDIYRAISMDGSPPRIERLQPPVNTPAPEDTPFVTPDGRVLFFSRRSEAGRSADIYVATAVADGGWTDPRPLREGVNSTAAEVCPRVSPDGDFLFFISNRSGVFRIYWIETSAVPEISEIIDPTVH